MSFLFAFLLLVFPGGHQKRGREIINYDVARGFFSWKLFWNATTVLSPKCIPHYREREHITDVPKVPYRTP